VYGVYAGSDLDGLNDMDRQRRPDGTCLSTPGCNTFFALQSAGMQTWVNMSNASYHGGQLVLRRPMANGWGFDFNYTLSHSIDIASSSETLGGTGSLIQDSFNPRASRASSDFDIRHNATANTVVELPWMKDNYVLGGWQLSMLARMRTGRPLNITNGGIYPTNYLNSALAILRPGKEMPETGTGFNQTVSRASSATRPT
jgi:hypothetical protein